MVRECPRAQFDALVYDQANGSDTLFSREGVRNTVYHRFSDFFAEVSGNLMVASGISMGTELRSVPGLFENCIASTKVKVFYTIQATKG